MKKKLLIATHSVFADGIKNAMELVTGEQILFLLYVHIPMT